MTEYEKLDILLQVIRNHPGDFITIQEEAGKQIRFSNYLEINSCVTRLRMDGHIQRTGDQYAVTTYGQTFMGYAESYRRSVAAVKRRSQTTARRTLLRRVVQFLAAAGIAASLVLGVVSYKLRSAEQGSAGLKSGARALKQSDTTATNRCPHP